MRAARDITQVVDLNSAWLADDIDASVGTGCWRIAADDETPVVSARDVEQALRGPEPLLVVWTTYGGNVYALHDRDPAESPGMRRLWNCEGPVVIGTASLVLVRAGDGIPRGDAVAFDTLSGDGRAIVATKVRGRGDGTRDVSLWITALRSVVYVPTITFPLSGGESVAAADARARAARCIAFR